MATFSKKEAINYGWTTVKGNLKTFILFALVLILIQGVPQGISSNLSEQMKNDPSSEATLGIFVILLSIAIAILNIVVSIGVIRFALKFLDGKKGEVKDLFATNKKEMWHFFLGSLLYGLRVILGYILFIVPGIIWSIKYSQYSYLIIDKGMGPSEAIKKSGEITEGNKMNLFLLGLLLALINIAGVLALFVGLFVTIPLTFLAQAYVYRKLVGATISTPAPTAVTEKPQSQTA